jgi:hypothetical protein
MHAAGTITLHERRHYAFIREIALAAVPLRPLDVESWGVGDRPSTALVPVAIDDPYA